MGAFDGEMYALGYRWRSRKQERATEETPERVAKRLFRETVHEAWMPCPGFCGSICPNHNCSAHNGDEYVRKPRKVLDLRKGRFEVYYI